MRIEDLLTKLGVSMTQKKKFEKRYEKLGIPVVDGTISDETAEKILKDKKDNISISDYVSQAMDDLDVSKTRVISDIRCRLSSEKLPVVPFFETTFAARPNTYYLHSDYMDALNRVIAEYRECVCLGMQFVVKVKRETLKKPKVVETGEIEVCRQQETYIGIMDYARLHQGWKDYTRLAKHRENLFYYLEDHDWFGIEKIEQDEILFKFKKDNVYFIKKSDITKLDEQMQRFFSEYGISDAQKLKNILCELSDNGTMRRFGVFLEETGRDVKPHVVNAAWSLRGLAKDIMDLTSDSVSVLLQRSESLEEKKLLIDFVNWVRAKEDVSYEKFIPKPREPKSVEAYSMSQYTAFCICVFNITHIKENQMVEKALSDIRYVGMWGYHTILLVMVLRGNDIEQILKFPDLDGDRNWISDVSRDAEGLEQQLLTDAISTDDYIAVGKWFVDSFNYEELKPNKTNAGRVVGTATTSVLAHLGKILLIGTVHRMRGKSQFLDIKKWGNCYNNRQMMCSFYGDKILQVLGRQNLNRTRINHTVAQMEMKAAQELGMDGFTAVSTAAYSRGHTNVNTMFHYIGDHALSGENASAVLWLMMERQVLGVVPYQMLLQSFPDAFGKLTAEEQTQIMKLSGISSMELEAILSYKYQRQEFKDSFFSLDEEKPLNILKTMLAIGQGYGVALDDGTYCMTRARGVKCEKKVRGSCIAAGCDENVLTTEAIPVIGNIIQEKLEWASQGDKKAEAVLFNYIVPRVYMIKDYLKGVLPEHDYEVIDSMIDHYLEVA